MRPHPNPPDFAEVLRQLRQQAELTQEELAARAGLHRTYVGALERGERQPTILTATRLADILGIGWAELGAALERTRGRIS